MSNRFKNILIVICPPPKKNGKPSLLMMARVRKTIKLARKNNYSKIIFSGGPSRRNSVPSGSVMGVMAMQYLDKDLLMVEKNSRDILHSSLFCWSLIKDKSPKKVTVLTGRFELARARYIFKKTYKHLGVSLSFEYCHDNLDIVESTYLRIKEFVKLKKLQWGGIR